MIKYIIKLGRATIIVCSIALALFVTKTDYNGSRPINNIRATLTLAITDTTRYIGDFLKKITFSKDKIMAIQIEETEKRANILGLYVQSVINENNALKKLLNYVTTDSTYKGRTYITTRIMGRSSTISSGTLLLNVGQDHGVEPGQAVINENGLLGKITRVWPDKSEVMLITDPKFRIPVVMRDSNEHGIFSGSTLNLNLVNKQSKVFDGEMAMTMGDDKNFPPYIPVGIVHSRNNELATIIYIDIFADITKLDYALIITGTEQDGN